MAIINQIIVDGQPGKNKIQTKEKMSKNDSPLEHMECLALVAYLDILQRQGKIISYTHIPQETYTGNWGTKMRNKREGVKPGMPDYVIVYPSKVLFLEMKRAKGGIVSPEQKEWLTILDGKSTATGVGKGFDSAKAIVDLLVDR